MGLFGTSWDSLRLSGAVWGCLELSGIVWDSSRFSGTLFETVWGCLGIVCSTLWGYLGLSGAVLDSLGLSLGLSGSLWESLGVSGNLWESNRRTIHECGAGCVSTQTVPLEAPKKNYKKSLTRVFFQFSCPFMHSFAKVTRFRRFFFKWRGVELTKIGPIFTK